MENAAATCRLDELRVGMIVWAMGAAAALYSVCAGVRIRATQIRHVLAIEKFERW
jgi:hypothetical protein